MAKEIVFDNEARLKIQRGVDKLANAVKVTLGPCGKNVILDKKYGAPVITKDGVSVAKEIEIQDPIENVGAQLIKEVASKTNDGAGDGTTTATVLAQSIYKNSLKFVTFGANPVEVKKGIDLAVNEIIKELKSISKTIGNNSKDIEQVATISANNDNEIGKMIADAMSKIGEDGVITVEEAKGTQTNFDVVEGLEFDRGYLSPYFVTNPEKMTIEMENPYILICDKKISVFKDILPALEIVAQNGNPLLIIADDIDGEALSTLVLNKLRGFKVAAVKAPGFGDRKKDILEDIAIITGGEVFSDERGLKLENVNNDSFGTAQKVKISKDNTVIVKGNGKKENIEKRKSQIKAQINNVTSDYDREKLQERLAKISGGVAVLYIGAATEVEMKEKKDRVDDALHATRAAVQEGVVPGGGVALLYCMDKIKNLTGENEDQNLGIKIILRSLLSPIKTILSNAGETGSDVVLNHILEKKEKDFGYNVRLRKYENFFQSGVIDPTKVTRLAIQNAASIAGLLITSDCVITDRKEEDSAAAGKQNNVDPGMGMM